MQKVNISLSIALKGVAFILILYASAFYALPADFLVAENPTIAKHKQLAMVEQEAEEADIKDQFSPDPDSQQYFLVSYFSVFENLIQKQVFLHYGNETARNIHQHQKIFCLNCAFTLYG